MKKLTFLFVLTFIFLSNLQAQHSEQRTISTFTKIDYEGYGELHLIQGDEPNVEVDVRKHHQLSDLITEVKGNTLYIYHDDRDQNWFGVATSFPRSNVYVTYQNLNEIELKGKVKIFSNDPIRSDDFELMTEGHVVGDLEIYAQQLEVCSEGYVRMNLLGETKSLEASVAGFGKISALELFTDFCEAEIEGGAVLEVYVREELDAEISGVGSIYYEGKPSKTKIDRNGLVRVRSCRM